MNRFAHLLTAWLLFSAMVCAQSPGRPTTFLGLPWGSSRSEVMRAAEANGASIPEDATSSNTVKIELTGGAFAGQQVSQWSFEFVRGKLVGATVMLAAPDGNTGALYRELKQELVKKYGPSQAERKFNVLTAEQRKSYIANGSRAPNRCTGVTWKFPPTLKDKETLSLSLEHAPPAGTDTTDETQFFVTLRYLHESLRAQLSNELETIEQSKPRAVQSRDL